MVAEVDAWFDWSARQPTTVGTTSELDAVLDTVAATGSPQVVQLLIHGDPGRGMLDVGLDEKRGRGALYYAGGEHRAGCASIGPDTAPEPPVYVYMGGSREFPANAEVPISDARKAAHEYMETGGARPTCIEWQPIGSPS